MTNSREKFEEHALDRVLDLRKESNGGTAYASEATREALFGWNAGYLAGRESMRDEAVKSCLGKQTSNECVISIKEIKP